MSKFMQKALRKLDKMDNDQIRALLDQLAAENENVRIVLDSIADGVLVTDQDSRLSLVNRSAARLVPFRPGEILQERIWEVVSDPDIAEFFRVSLENQERVRDTEFTLANGVTVTLSFSIYPLVREGKIEGNVVHVENITDKKKEQTRLRRAESLAALTTLTAGVAHEIKNPLGSIGIHLQLIQKTVAASDSVRREDVEPYISVINEEVERLNRIVVDFLFAVRPMDADLVKSDLNGVVRDLVQFVQYELQDAGVSTELALEEGLPLVELDENFLKQALLNIVQNATSAMPGGGTLRISTAAAGEDVLLRISDSGQGIGEQDLSKIWEPYFTTKDFGSGLGLTLVFKIVKEHKGEVAVESKEGEGTTFTISLPIPQEERKLIRYDGKGA